MCMEPGHNEVTPNRVTQMSFQADAVLRVTQSELKTMLVA